ncbi:site-specific integrase [Marinobacter nauticus]|nr:site-specific integrase [Marinobacter nauticus]
MTNTKYVSLTNLHAAERRVEQELAFTATCKNDGRTRTWDFKKKSYADSQRPILEIFVWSLYKLRNKHGNKTRESIYDLSNRFFEFLEDVGVNSPDEIDSSLMNRFVSWFKKSRTSSYATNGSRVRSLRGVLEKMGDHPKINRQIRLPKNPFPKGTSLQSANTGYDHDEFRQILNTVVLALRENKRKYESSYEPRFLGDDPPLDGVAPYRPETGKYVMLASHDYRVWFFENRLKCKTPLQYRNVMSVPGGHSWWYAIIRDYPHESYRTIEGFLEFIGVGPGYKPKFLGDQNPVKYITPWKKKDYVIWYFENKMNATPHGEKVLKERHREFRIAMREHYGGYKEFFKELNVWYEISTYDLAPYYLMLLIRTGLNPSTIQRLTIDCIRKDPLDGRRKYIDWEKFRSLKQSSTIPEEKAETDTWAIAIIERVIRLTKRIRNEGQKELWISNANREGVAKPYGDKAFAASVRRIFKKHPVYSSGNGERLNVTAAHIRPTIAWSEYLRTEDLQYLSQLLGHSNVTITAEYLRRVDDPVFRTRRAIHSEAMLIGMTQGSKEAKEFIKEKLDTVKSKDHINGIYDGLLNHCKDPKTSPVTGEKPGQFCSADSDVCLPCQNLVITPEDIKKHFCFLKFHEHLFSVGDISEQDLRKATEYKSSFWSSYILPKYPDIMLQDIEESAKRDPCPEWDIVKYEESKK